jgi:hypothetical protein
MGKGEDKSKRKKRGAPSDKTVALRARSKKAQKTSSTTKNFLDLYSSAAPGTNAAVIDHIVTTSGSGSAPSQSTSSASCSVPAPSRPSAVTEERRDAPHQPDITAELDDDEQLQDEPAGDGVMQTLLVAVQSRLKDEVADTKQPLLLSLLKENDWWVRAVHAPKVCRILGHTESFVLDICMDRMASARRLLEYDQACLYCLDFACYSYCSCKLHRCIDSSIASAER